MNKKADAFTAIIFIVFLIAGLIALIAGISSLFLNKGSSTDYPYTIEKSNFWNKLWLKDDHTTVYCYDDERFTSVIQRAIDENKKVKVEFQEYVFRGSLCFSGSDKISEVVITNVEVME